MRRVLTMLVLAGCAMVAAAESHDPADYPLRVHIFKRSETTFYRHHVEEEARGQGRANLFEGGEVKGIDFQFECDDKLQTSSGWETFPAKWKKPGQELIILEPKYGKDGFNSCHLKVMVKDFAYLTRNGGLTTEPTSVYKEWMVAHNYDPEHGKNEPTRGGPDAVVPRQVVPPVGMENPPPPAPPRPLPPPPRPLPPPPQ